MGIPNTSLENGNKKSGDIINASLYSDLNRLLENDKNLDQRLATCQSHADEGYKKVTGA